MILRLWQPDWSRCSLPSLCLRNLKRSELNGFNADEADAATGLRSKAGPAELQASGRCSESAACCDLRRRSAAQRRTAHAAAAARTERAL